MVESWNRGNCRGRAQNRGSARLKGGGMGTKVPVFEDDKPGVSNPTSSSEQGKKSHLARSCMRQGLFTFALLPTPWLLGVKRVLKVIRHQTLPCLNAQSCAVTKQRRPSLVLFTPQCRGHIPELTLTTGFD
ncbi:hypothetical protein VNO77_08766 [Canavalia gladiata]|uniref:Uncharacterized protein n=1 Tax=Canavalia gladiata TaxID=3824 RepID=A0AAN9M9F4_CANGL